MVAVFWPHVLKFSEHRFNSEFSILSDQIVPL